MAQSITASVGEGGKNRPLDVATVQALLFWLHPDLGGPGIEDGNTFVDAQIGPTTIAAIKHFQQVQFRLEDGLIEPGDFTMRRLNAVVDKLAEGELGPVTNPFAIKEWALRRARIQDPTIVDLGREIGAEHMLFGGGIRATFENGIIIHHPALGAFEVHGRILEKYISGFPEEGLDEEDFGYPISDQRRWTTVPGGLVSHFEFGSIFSQLQASGDELVGYVRPQIIV